MMLRFKKRLLWMASVVLLLADAGSGLGWAEDQQNGDEKKAIDLEWIYKKDELGIKGLDPDLPRSFQWSKEGHMLAYLVSFATEAPHLVVFDPAKNATAFCITPYALHDSLIKLASQPEGIVAASATHVAFVPEDATAVKNIDSYEWKKDALSIRLNIDQKKYLWSLDDAVIKEEDEKRDLPEGPKDDVTYSPNERYAAYTRGNNLFVYDTEQRKEIQLTQDGGASILNGKMTWVYWEELHYRRGYKAFYWSPGSDSLAYLQFDESGVSTYPVTDFSKPIPETRNMSYPKVGTKNPTVRLGVASLSTRDTRWIDLGEPYEYIARVEWRPDGKALAVQTLNRAQNHLTLLYADPYTGRSQIILEETDDAWVNAHGGPYYLDDEGDEFLWLSERSGYRHLYRYSKDGENVKQLTQGEWEVNPSLWEVSVPIDKKNGWIFFNAFKDSPLETHLYSVSSKGGRIQRLTSEPGSHHATFSEDMQYAVRYFSSLTTPNRIDVIDRRGKVIRTLGETTIEDYAPYQAQIPELVEMESSEGITYYGRILKPYDFEPGKKYPTIVYMYAGPAGQVVGNHFVSDRDLAMANRGFVLFSFDTRGTTGRGREWINAIHHNACDIPLQDLQFAKEYLQKLPYVDAEHLGIWGWSNGGYMTCCAMLKIPGTFQAGAAVAPVSDYHLYDTIYTERYMGLPDENPEGYKESSAVNFADGLQGKLMIAHGVSDDNVHIQNVYQLVNALIEAEKDYELYVYPERDHGIGGDDRRYHLFQTMFQFFERNLKTP